MTWMWNLSDAFSSLHLHSKKNQPNVSQSSHDPSALGWTGFKNRHHLSTFSFLWINTVFKIAKLTYFLNTEYIMIKDYYKNKKKSSASSVVILAYDSYIKIPR